MMEDNKIENYGTKFQESALRFLIQDKKFISKIHRVLKPEYFDNKQYQLICKIVLDFYEKFSCQPSNEDLIRIGKEVYENEKQRNLLNLYIGKILDAETERYNYITEEMLKFCNMKNILIFLEQAKNYALNADFDAVKLSMKNAMVGFGEAIEIINLTEDYSSAFNEENHHPFPTFLPSLNKHTQGGPGKGDFCLMMAPSNFGKTAWLTALARHSAFNEGKKVLYISLETKAHQIAKRLLSGEVDCLQEEIILRKKDVEKSILKLKEKGGNVMLYRFKSGKFDINQLENLVNDLKAEGFFPEQIFIDYLQLMKTRKGVRTSSENSNDKIESICEDLRDFAGEEAISLWSAIQTNRSGFGSGEATEQQVSKGIESFFIADVFLGASQTPEEAVDGVAKIKILKNRLGNRGIIINVRYNPNNAIFTEEGVENEPLSQTQVKKITGNIDEVLVGLTNKRTSTTSLFNSSNPPF